MKLARILGFILLLGGFGFLLTIVLNTPEETKKVLKSVENIVISKSDWETLLDIGKIVLSVLMSVGGLILLYLEIIQKFLEIKSKRKMVKK